MSVYSGSHFSTSKTSNNRCQSRVNKSDSQKYLCPKCNMQYKYFAKYHVFHGKIPLILHCNHTLCEECVQDSYSKGGVICIECGQFSPIDTSQKQRLQEIFPVNFYLLGVMSYLRPHVKDQDMKLQPTGMTYTNLASSQFGSTSTLCDQPESLDFILQGLALKLKDKCCKDLCKNSASLRCLECNEVFCEYCCEPFHNSTRSFRKHRIVPTAVDIVPEALDKCAVHKENPLEFLCNLCEKYCCCYCLIQEHNGHSFSQISKADLIGTEDFKMLIESAGEKLKRLILAHKNVRYHLQRASMASNNPIDAAIGTYFLRLHARLQSLEKQIRSNSESIKTKHIDALNEIDEDLRSNIRTLHGLIDTALNVNDETNKVKVNVQNLIDKLKSFVAVPCYLIGQEQVTYAVQFNCEDPFENLEETVSSQFKETETSFRLLREDELPENYHVELPDDLASLEVVHLNRSLTRSPESVSSNSSMALSQNSSVSHTRSKPSKMTPKTKAVEGWIKGVHESTFTINTPIFKPKDRHSVNISYIANPENFYVQVDSQMKELQRLHEEIQNYVKRFTARVKRIPEIGSLYIVNYHATEWYRGRVIDIEKSSNCNVYTVEFIDYGNTKLVTELKDFIEIIGAFSEPPPFAQRCKLFDMHPTAPCWSERETRYMAEIIAGTEVIMVIMEYASDILEVDLLSCSGAETTSVRDALLFAGYGVSELKVVEPTSSITMQSIRSNVKLHTGGQSLKNGDELTVYISNVINLQNIYVQVIDHFHHVEHLNIAMSDYYIKKDKVRGENIYNPKTDMVVAVNLHDKYYRATITQVNQGKGSVVVLLVDYGKTVTVHYSLLRKLPNQFRTLECQAILVKLSHIRRTSDKEMDKNVQNYLKPYIDKKTKLRLVVVNKEEIPSVVLFETLGSMESCLNKALIDEELAKPFGDISELGNYSKYFKKKLTDSKQSYVIDLLSTIQSSRDNEPQEDSDSDSDNQVIKKRIHILSCTSPDEIFVELVDPSAAKLYEEMHSSLQVHYSKKRKAEKRDWKIDDLCVVYNTKCNQFFRGIITNKIEDKFKVMLQDIVQEIVVPSAAIFVLHDQFKQHRERAIRCHLASVTPAGDKNKWSGLAIDFLRNIFDQYHDISMTKNGAVDRDRKSVPVSMWYTETKLGGALERSKQILHNVNKLLVKNGLALKLASNGTEVKTEFDDLVAVPVENKEEDQKTQDLSTSKAIRATSAPIERTIDVISVSPRATTTMNHTFSEMSAQNPSDYYALFFKPINENQLKNNASPITAKSVDWNEIVEKDLLMEANSHTVIVNGEELPQRAAADLHLDNLQIDQQINLSEYGDDELRQMSESTFNNSDISLMQKQPHMIRSNEVTDWLPPIPINEKNFRAIVTNVGSNGTIYAHLSSKKDALNYMGEKMNTYFKQTQPEPIGTVWMTGQLCTVKYHLNDEWYRGKIINVSKDIVSVFLIDFGNEEEVQHDDLRFGVMYLHLPPFANKIQLYQVHPLTGSTWLTSDLDELHKILVENEIEVSVIKKSSRPDMPISALVKLDNVNINEYMRNYSTNLVISVSTDGVDKDDSDSDVIIEDEQYDDISTSPLSFTRNLIPQKMVGEKIEVTVTTLTDYNEVLLEILCDCNVDEVRQLFEEISEDIQNKGDTQPLLNTLQIGSACIAKYSEDEQWYRGEIINLDQLDRNEVYVWFIDFGNYESVPISCIKTVDPHWFKLPVLQYKAIIDGIRLNDISQLSVVLECMSDYCSTHKLAEIVSVEPLHVKLYNDDELAYQDLIDQGLLIKTN
ncbi:hypothetical protein PPYR_05008 [Photinus pyralis]|uniref:RING finger protein 17 n=1 Tax=Photinus pyralis TaxID=7054 RepID=A0A5N4AZP5_PHOPY|nr:uncharacterized protein LOC116162747 isoform X1 [Photinus pyralis]KAB0802822.1 hypothetical protein PPYR_05008 [Photinus pyralis]